MKQQWTWRTCDCWLKANQCIDDNKWNIQSPTKTLQGIKPMVIIPPLGLLLYTRPNILTIFWDVDISILVESPSCPSYSTDKANMNSNKFEELVIIDLNLINILIMTGEKTEHLPRSSTNLWGIKIRISRLDTTN